MSLINVGNTDRKVRFALGIIFAALAVFFALSGQYVIAGGLVLGTVIAVGTAAKRTCPVYLATGISTSKGNQE